MTTTDHQPESKQDRLTALGATLRNADGPMFCEACKREVSNPAAHESVWHDGAQTCWPRLTCPDGGTCHHVCESVAACFRVECCAPLSGVFPNDQWPTECPIPDNLSAAELGEWLDGAGFTLITSLTVQGSTCRVYQQHAVPVWPEYVTVTVSAHDDREYVVLEHVTDDDIPHDSSCGCDFCRDDRGEEVFSMTARREMGRDL